MNEKVKSGGIIEGAATVNETEYQGIYNILNSIKEDVNSLKLTHIDNSNKLDSLSKEVTTLAKNNEQLRSALYKGDYGKDSIIERIQNHRSEINKNDQEIASLKSHIRALQDRWVKTLWGLVVLFITAIVSFVLSAV